MAINKIKLMHIHFGIGDGLCANCSHLVEKHYSNKTWRKRKAYGDSSSPSTDWKLSNIACGLFPGKPYTGRDVVRLVRPERAAMVEEQIEGQIGLFDFPEVTP